MCKTLVKFPTIGKDIEDFVEEHRVGADQWRRTGVFTFDGNQKKGPNVSCLQQGTIVLPMLLPVERGKDLL